MREVEWGNLRAPELRALGARGAIAVVPVGSIEQHGPHLPVQVDTLLATEVARRAARRVAAKQPIVVTPTVWSGLAEHHMSLGATITLDFETFAAVLRCVCRSVLRHGFRRILLLNGHGGNITALNVIAGELSRELDAPITTATYWTLSGTQKPFQAILDKQKTVRHACEAETSMLLALKPGLVDKKAMKTVKAPMDGLTSEGGAYRYRPIAHWTKSGVIGAPAAASAEKGERLLNAAAKALADVLASGSLWASSSDAPRTRRKRR
ncbi:MAG: creatininase family protein [Alphaproteobacteria bacterium]